MKRKIIEILNQADFSANFISYVQQQFPKDFQQKFINPYQVKCCANPINNLSPEEALFESLPQLLELQDYYERQEIPLPHFYNSIYDLNFRVERYYENHNTYGLNSLDIRWLSPLYKGEIFDLGSLRFQISGFSYSEIERSDYQFMPLPKKWKEQFPEGTPIITIHILKDTDFRPDKIDASLQLARDFFQKHFPEYEYDVFLTRTWLIYGPIREILKPNSNIAAFSKRFKIIAENQNTKQALDRIYGTSDLDAIEKMEKQSSLEKTAYKNLDKLGVAAGFIYK